MSSLPPSSFPSSLPFFLKMESQYVSQAASYRHTPPLPSLIYYFQPLISGSHHTNILFTSFSLPSLTLRYKFRLYQR